MNASSRSFAAREVTFHDMVGEQLRHAPWLAISLLLHALALLLLWALMPAPRARAPANHATIVDTAQEAVQQPEPEKKLEATPEPTTDDVQLLPDPVLDQNDDADNPDVADAQVESAFDFTGLNTAVGIGGGATGPYTGRGKGHGPHGGVPAGAMTGIRNALLWLARHQDEDGKWDCDQFMKHDTEGEVCDGAGNAVHDVGVTGLALLAFLGDNNTLRAGPYKDVVKRGVKWLRDQQQENGLFGTNTSHDFVYDHAIATYAMCEAFGLSDYTLLRPVAQKAINYLESHRNPYGVWRYQPRDNDNDTSVTGWCIMAYESGEFFGLTINKTALQLAASWLDQVTDATGRHGYSKIGEPSSRKRGEHETRFPVDKGEAMTAVGLFCRFFMNQDPKEKPIMNAAADRILQKKPVWDEKGGAIDSYYWYYGTYALFQKGGRHWDEWRKALDKAVVQTQEVDASKPNLKGSWSPIHDCWGDEGGRVYTTAILALTLQAYYRYTRLLR